MAAIRAMSTANMILLKEIFASRLLVPCLSSCSTSSAAASSSSLSLRTAFSAFPGTPSPSPSSAVKVPLRGISYSTIRCAASQDDKKVSARFSQVQQLLQEAQERAASAGNDPPPKITLDHVTISFARSSGPGGQNVNKVNTKVDMRFNVQNAYWLSERIRERIMQLEKNRMNKDGEIVISSTKTRSQKDNIEDALAKLQAIIDAASYVPPPPSEEKKKKIAKLAAESEQKRLKSKKALSDKKAFRRSRNSWD